MKFTIVLLFVFVVGVLSSQSFEETNAIKSSSSENTDYDDFRQKVSDFIDLIVELAPEGFQKTLLTVFASSLNTKCMMDRYVENNLTLTLTLLLNETSKDSNSTPLIVFADIAAMCSWKTYELLDFVFDNLMTYRTLYGMLEDSLLYSPELKTFKRLLTCANIYAVKNGIIDPELYKFNDKLMSYESDAEAKCQGLYIQGRYFVLRMQRLSRDQTYRSCSMKVVDQVKRILMKNVLLLQINLTAAQIKKEKKIFFDDVQQVMKSILDCANQVPDGKTRYLKADETEL
jgi:hypothetical protein